MLKKLTLSIIMSAILSVAGLAQGTKTTDPAAGKSAPKTATAPKAPQLAPGVTEADITNAKAKGMVWANTDSKVYHKDGKYYGVPFDWGAVGMFYNKALFKQAGLDPEKPPTTWTELLDAVKALKAAGITPIAIGEKDKWPGHFWYGYLATREAGQAGRPSYALR